MLRMPAPPLVPVSTARRLLLSGAGLLADPARRAGPAAVLKTIKNLGFVQVDTIQVAVRAHHHILHARLDGYRPRMLERLLERDRTCFEHWTHDASVIPTEWFPMWKIRFARYRDRGHSPTEWWAGRMGGEPEKLIAHVRERITDEGPLASRHFEHDRPDGENGAWWGWKPQKAALEYLWRTGELGVSRRVQFHKHYDLMERVLPDVASAAPPDDDAHLDWACAFALDRLGVATAAELAGFFRAVSTPDARAWVTRAVERGDAVPVRVESADGSKPRAAVALPDWERRARRLADPPTRMRLLSPFDPVIRDRRRALRLFGFDYRFEAFTPAPKRRYGYYVLPVLEGDRLVARLDPKLHRAESTLEVRGLWWEPDVRVTRTRRAAMRAAAERLATLGEATSITYPRGSGMGR